ncbi:MAG: 2-amino-4-hydroxy-6-hydroxymethyldihydropteridine diphosphokinase [Armatimonadetes bacterium]|nr:2-amino-4-hydroxy-6-hydroxymethyldihydropteridine diphosphokinase [Armatimonadota bacterium]
MPRVFVAVGSNIDPEKNVSLALGHLAREFRVVDVSTFYCTEPEGRPEQPPYYNGVVEIETPVSAVDLKQHLRQIEGRLGRNRTEDKFAPRPIDLDIVLYCDDNVPPGIEKSDPEISSRAFIAVPLSELAPDLALPDSGRPIKDIASGFAGHSMKPLLEYTRTLRREMEDNRAPMSK